MGSLTLLGVGSFGFVEGGPPPSEGLSMVPTGQPVPPGTSAGLSGPIIFNAVPIAEPNPERRIVITVTVKTAALHAANSSFTVEVGGVDAEQIVVAPLPTEAQVRSEIWWTPVFPTGTTADIIIEGFLGGWIDGIQIEVYSITGDPDIAVQAIVTDAKWTPTNDDYISATVPMSSGAEAVFIGLASGDATSSWGNAIKVRDAYWVANGTPMSGMAAYKTIGGTHSVGLEVTSWGGGAGSYGFIGAVFAPASEGVPDTTAPILTLPTGTKTSDTTATLTVTTDEGDGVWYGTASAGIPTTLQTKLGHDSLGAVSNYSFNQPVVATGLQTRNATGLSPNTPYTMHYVQEDADGNDMAAPVSATPFTTDAAAGSWSSPLDASTPAVWWMDASDLSTFTLAGSAPQRVSEWRDKGLPTPHHMTPSATTSPSYEPGWINGKAGVFFAPTTDLRTIAFTIPQPFMLDMVWKSHPDNLPALYGILWDGDRIQVSATRAVILHRRGDLGDRYAPYAGVNLDQGVSVALNTLYHTRILFHGAGTISILNASTVNGNPGPHGVVNGIMLGALDGGNTPWAGISEAYIIPYADAAAVTANYTTDAASADAYRIAKWGF
jgi:hypothetical protein